MTVVAVTFVYMYACILYLIMPMYVCMFHDPQNHEVGMRLDSMVSITHLS